MQIKGGIIKIWSDFLGGGTSFLPALRVNSSTP